MPHTLAEALAATYANQPALQAERAKLRATDENVPQALAGWRPTVVMAGTAGYGDGMSRAVFRRFRRLPECADRPADRHRAGDADAAAVYRRQDSGQRQPRQEPGDGGTRQPDRAGADQLHQRGQCLCRRHPGAAASGTEHQQRAGAGQAAPGDQRPLPGRRDHAHRRGAGRSGAGRCDRATPDCRRQSADRARHVPAGGRLICRPATWSSRSRSPCR